LDCVIMIPCVPTKFPCRDARRILQRDKNGHVVASVFSQHSLPWVRLSKQLPLQSYRNFISLGSSDHFRQSSIRPEHPISES
jgi:hypothetical protein